MDPLLYGHNPEERIVAIHQLNDQTIRLFKREKGNILLEDVEFFPFFFLADNSLINDFPKRFWLKELAGTNYYRYIAAFSHWSEMWEAIHYILREYNKKNSSHVSSYQELKEILVRPDAVRQFLLQSGITLFKGMEFNELVRLFIDVQYTQAIARKRKGKNNEQIFVVTLKTNNGKQYSLTTLKQDEKALLKRLVQHINRIDPDVIEGYDLFGNILPALLRCSERHNIPLSIGRDGTDIRTPGRYGSSGTGETDWSSFDITGRHFIDLLILAETIMDVKRASQPISLTSLARNFGVLTDVKHVIPMNKLRETWEQEPKKVTNQSSQSTHIVQQCSDLLSPPLFYLAQICPLNYRVLAQISEASRIESLMLREYVRQRQSIPRPIEGSRSVSTPAEIFQTGVFSNVLYVELKNVYSSIMLQQRMSPKTDALEIFVPLLTHLSSLQQELLALIDTKQSQQFDTIARVRAIQLLLDSFHLYIGSAKGLFNDPVQAEILLNTAREIYKEIVHQMEIFNVTIIQSDGVGFFILPPDNIVGETNERHFIERLSNTLPYGIKLVLSNHYEKMFSHRKRNYSVLTNSGALLIKGNSIISRGMEQYLKVFAQRCIECLLTNDFKRLHHTYASSYTQVIRHQWTPNDFCKIEVARVDSETYHKEALSEKFTLSPAMEAAARSGLFVKANTKISYYIVGTDPDVDVTQSSRLAEDWDPNLPDENTAYYLARMHETIQKFKEFFDPSAFERILSLDEMFGFSDEGIHILSKKITQEISEAKPETEEYGIWLAETD